MMELPSVTLFCVDCVNAKRAVAIMEHCRAQCTFGAVKLLTSLPTTYKHRVSIAPLRSLVAYSIFMLKQAHLYIDTPQMLIVQHDGFILNPDSWKQEWLEYDYMGPLFIQDYPKELMVGSGGFSFRSKALMEFVSKHTPDCDGSKEDLERVQAQLSAYEDGVISHGLKCELVKAGFKFPTPEEAAQFAQGGWPQPSSPERDSTAYYVPRPFGFHGIWRNINWSTGEVSPPPFEPAMVDQSSALKRPS